MTSIEQLHQRIDSLCDRLRLGRRVARGIRFLTALAEHRQFFSASPEQYAAGLVAARFRWDPPELMRHDAAVSLFARMLGDEDPTEQLLAFAAGGRQEAHLVRQLNGLRRVNGSRRTTRSRADAQWVRFAALDQRIDDLSVQLHHRDHAHWRPLTRAKEEARNKRLTRWSPAERAARALARDVYVIDCETADRGAAWRAAAVPVFHAILDERALTNEQRAWLLRSDDEYVRGLACSLR
jgi:hypothetical protein